MGTEVTGEEDSEATRLRKSTQLLNENQEENIS
jgi:hypothetical protein